TAHEPRRLEDAVRRMEECGRIARQRFVEILAPLGGEARLAERLVLLPELVAFLLVCRETQTAGPSECVIRDARQRVQLPLRPAPEVRRRVIADRLSEHRIRRRAPAQREPTVPPARATGDLARL